MIRTTRCWPAVRGVAILAAGCLFSGKLGAQSLRIAAWGQYEGVTGSDDWSGVGAQLAFATTRGDAVWIAGESLSRFGARDATARVGGTLRATPRWWISAEAGTASLPDFAPKNSWEADATALVAPRVSVGLGYRHLNYVVGPVDVVMPHLTVQTGAVSWDARVFLSRNTSERTDAALYVRATGQLPGGSALWILGAAGRESYLVGTGPMSAVQSLETMTGAAGVRAALGRGLTVLLEAMVTGSRPRLARRGGRVGLERRF